MLCAVYLKNNQTGLKTNTIKCHETIWTLALNQTVPCVFSMCVVCSVHPISTVCVCVCVCVCIRARLSHMYLTTNEQVLN